jgi:hypothetical protein
MIISNLSTCISITIIIQESTNSIQIQRSNWLVLKDQDNSNIVQKVLVSEEGHYCRLVIIAYNSNKQW